MGSNLFWLSDEQWAGIAPCFRGTCAARIVQMIGGLSAASCMC